MVGARQLERPLATSALSVENRLPRDSRRSIHIPQVHITQHRSKQPVTNDGFGRVDRAGGRHCCNLGSFVWPFPTSSACEATRFAANQSEPAVRSPMDRPGHPRSIPNRQRPAIIPFRPAALESDFSLALSRVARWRPALRRSENASNSPACLGTAVLGNGRAFECNGTTRTRHGPALEVGRSGGVESSTGLRGRGGGRPNRHLSARVPILHGTRLVTAPARL